ncbi:hypothetical protein BDSB_07640 [Burkholderia dolosa PC543]|nr:hypothetical protein BDSB_07640 [Burkholderia dolosa PC543]
MTNAGARTGERESGPIDAACARPAVARRSLRRSERAK